MKIRFVLLRGFIDIGRLQKALDDVFDGTSSPCLTEVQAYERYPNIMLVVTSKRVTQEDGQRIYGYYKGADINNHPLHTPLEIRWPDPNGPILLPREEDDEPRQVISC